MYNMFSTPLICCSKGVATDLSTLVELAPENDVLTCTVGGVISGYCSTAKPKIETPPIITIKMAITMATMGRLTKKIS